MRLQEILHSNLEPVIWKEKKKREREVIGTLFNEDEHNQLINAPGDQKEI